MISFIESSFAESLDAACLTVYDDPGEPGDKLLYAELVGAIVLALVAAHWHVTGCPLFYQKDLGQFVIGETD
jgi:hypothetical protein